MSLGAGFEGTYPLHTASLWSLLPIWGLKYDLPASCPCHLLPCLSATLDYCPWEMVSQNQLFPKLLLVIIFHHDSRKVIDILDILMTLK